MMTHIVLSTLLLSLEGTKAQRKIGFSQAPSVRFASEMSGGRELAQAIGGGKDPGQQTSVRSMSMAIPAFLVSVSYPLFVDCHSGLDFQNFSFTILGES